MASRPEKLRVVVADDHPFFRRALVRTLTDAGMDVVAEVSNGELALLAVERERPDVVVLDLNMPVVSGVEATRQLMQRAPGTRVLVLSVSAEQADVTEAIIAGARGYVLKDAPREEVVHAIRAVAGGESVISPEVAAMLLRGVRARDEVTSKLPPVGLTDPERDLLDLLAQGSDNAEIGSRLGMQPGAVSTHLGSVLAKLHAANRLQAALYGPLL